MKAPGDVDRIDGQYKLKRMVLLLLGLLAAGRVSPAEEVFIDPSRNNGCPGAGTISDPYCDWASIRECTGGNAYLQRRGTTYRSMIRCLGARSKESSSPIYIGGYGIGKRPRIRIEHELPNWNEPAKWSEVRANVWGYDTTGLAIGDPQVLLLNGRRAFGKARDLVHLCETRGTQTIEWYHKAGTLYLCAADNPATTFKNISGMHVMAGKDVAAIRVDMNHDIVIDGYELEGGQYGAVYITGGSRDIEIRNSIIGKDSANGISIVGSGQIITNIKVHDNVIDSGIRWGVVGYEPLIPGEGIYLANGVGRSRIFRNTIVAWPHTGTYLISQSNGQMSVRENLIYDNEYHCGPKSSFLDYCRPFSVDGNSMGSAEMNVFFRNRLHDFSVRCQINGNNNYIVGNVCYGTVNSKAKSFPTGQCFSIQPYGISKNNVVANNTTFNTADVAIEFVGGGFSKSNGHHVLNNIFYNCGQAAALERRNACIYVEDSPSVGAQVIRHNILFNASEPAVIVYRELGTLGLTDIKRSVIDVFESNMTMNPRLRDVENQDFSLLPDSPALGAGVRISVPLLNYQGFGRDIGAVARTQVLAPEPVPE